MQAAVASTGDGVSAKGLPCGPEGNHYTQRVSGKRVRGGGMAASEEGWQAPGCAPAKAKTLWASGQGPGKRPVLPSPSTGKGKSKKVAPESDTGMSSKNSSEMAGQEEGGADVQTEEEGVSGEVSQEAISSPPQAGKRKVAEARPWRRREGPCV